MGQSFLRSYFQELPAIEGWFSGEAALLFMAYNQLIAAEGVAGDVLEIGVHHGKSAIAVACLKAEDGRLYAVDLFEDGQSENVSGSGSGDRKAFTDNMQRFLGTLDGIEVIAVSSQELKPDRLGRRFSFCHVDGGHSARETYLDLQLCEQVLLPGGLVALDDYFNEWFPGVSEGAARYLVEHTGSLTPVAIGFNKVLFQKDGPPCDLRKQFAERFGYVPRSATTFWGAPTDLFIAGLSLFVDLDRSTPSRFVPSDAFPYALEIAPMATRVRASGHDAVELPVRVCNRSTGAFPPGAAPAGLSYHLFASDGSVVRWDNPRAAIEPSLNPGEERCLTVPITAPPQPGRFTVELDIVWENITWLKDRGNRSCTVDLTVVD